MALIKLYESANAVTLYGTETWGGTLSTYGWYMRRHDCVVYNNGGLNGIYKIFRDGTTCRVTTGDVYQHAYDWDLDLTYIINSFGSANYYNDPIGLRFNPSLLARFTSLAFGYSQSFVWNQLAYRVGGATVTKYNMSGVSQGTFSLTGSISPFVADTWAITDDGIFVGIDTDNGTQGVVRFYDMATGTNLYTSVIDKSIRTFVDTTHNHIWSINAATGKMQVYSFDVAPTTFSAITMGANRCRYREDALSVTLTGSASEPVRNWPVKWTLTTAEGHLKDTVTLTDTSGVATNTYCGPGADDYVGGSQTITVETGY